MPAQTIIDKIWHSHVVDTLADGTAILYIDRHLVHEVTSPQAFAGMRSAGRKVRKPNLTLAVPDHNVPTEGRALGIADPESKLQVETLERNCKEFGVPIFTMNDTRQGIVHIIGPEQGFTLPGTTVVCGDSHTATHGAFGAMSFGIGTSEVEHVLSTQTLLQKPLKTLGLKVEGNLGFGITSKDLILAIIGHIGTSGGTGHAIEFSGKAITDLSMEGRMTVCNMTIEAGARVGLIAPDETTFAYLKGRPMAPKGDAWQQAEAYWRSLTTDAGASYDKEIIIDASDIAPTVTWGTSPEDIVQVSGNVPRPHDFSDEAKQKAVQRSLDYMGLKGGEAISDIPIDTVFIGSCTNGRIEDLRSAAKIAKGRKVAANVTAMVVPGSGLVKMQAEKEGIADIFKQAGFQWREPGCSMCLAMNADKLKSGERCASTSNRNFEGRQGRGGRTHLCSPSMAAAAAITGQFIDVRELL